MTKRRLLFLILELERTCGGSTIMSTVSHLQNRNSCQLNARTCRLGKSGVLNDGSASTSGSFEILLQPLTYIHASHTTRLFRSEKAAHVIALSLTLSDHQRDSVSPQWRSECVREGRIPVPVLIQP